jgi:hypothetical protein
MPTPVRAWLKALLVCGVACLAVAVLDGSTPAHAQATGRVPVSPTVTHAPLRSSTPAPAAPVRSPASSAPSPSTPPPGTPTSNTPTPSASAPDPLLPGVPGTSSPPPDGGSGGCGLFDVSCAVQHAITGFFRTIVKDALNPVFRLLARSLLASPRVDQMSRVHSLWLTSLWITDTGFVLLVIVAGILIMGYQTLQTSYTAKDIAPRLVVAMVAAHVNLLVIGQAIDFANAISVAFMGEGVDPGQAAGTLKGLMLAAVTDGGLIMPILGVVAVGLALVVLITYTARVMLLVLLTSVAPLALACHALPQTEGLARLWWRALGGVLGIQIAKALVFATAIRIFFTSDQAALFGGRSASGSGDLLLVICLLYILARIPSWVSQMIFRGGMGRSPILRLARTAAAVLIFRGMAGKLSGSRAAVKPSKHPLARPAPAPVVPPGVSPGAPSRWVQPELPVGMPASKGEQLQLPLDVPGQPAPRPRSPAPRWVQLRLPDKTARPPGWTQTTLPIRPRYTQTQLPAPPPKRYTQPELPLSFPQPGTPAAGRAPRRLADQAALRDAEARARRRTTTPNPPAATKPSRRRR